MPEMPHILNLIETDLCGKKHSEPTPPETYRFMIDINASHIKQILDIAQGQRIPDIHHHSQTDDVGRGLEVADDPIAMPSAHNPDFTLTELFEHF
jgi:hypothetical protein